MRRAENRQTNYTHCTQLQQIAYMGVRNPSRRNALNLDAIEELAQHLQWAKHASDVAVIVLADAAGQSFCAGADLQELAAAATLKARLRFFLSLAKLIEELQYFPKPTIAKVQGYALAGGMGLVAACDTVWASDDAQFGLPEVRVGLAPLVVLAPLTRRIGAHRSAQLALSGRRCSALEALSCGLIDRICPAADIDLEVEALARDIAGSSPAALALSKRRCSLVSRSSYRRDIQKRARESANFSLEPDAREGIAAFFEKRSPLWPSTAQLARKKGARA
jgi:enoyl-CoA hydratase